ncbi:transglutaminase-like domain-containing protein [Stagnihabitans tardus]|uniref:Transglutaminase family protein n=1 Tax=Stagnihabitans tardus TaxID=2699202 RepID=A0AAE4YAL0_9RHOB|nr:transglutaminase family protein [Stagnihabitans tardus]NBZ89113.1 transglutaminase family protein [Stagnihabitans tardus]
MLIRYGYDITVSCPQDTPLITMMSVRDERRDDIRIQGAVETFPAVPTRAYRDMFGNTCRRVVAPAGLFRLRADCTIESDEAPNIASPDLREVPVADLPDSVVFYLLGSRYCETDRLSQFAWDMFGAVTPGQPRVQAICDYVHNHIRFDYMKARVTRTAYEAWQEQTGVCRDFAHLAVTLCRCMNIPTRYVNGYLGDIGVPVTGPMDFAAWMECYLDHAWHTFDPRNNKPRIGRIVVAHGRDAADVPLIHSFGPHVLEKFAVWTDRV